MSRTLSALIALFLVCTCLPSFSQSLSTSSQAVPRGPETHGISSATIVNVVLDCGAVGDGTTDDWHAIQTCMDNHPGKTIFFPKMRNVPCTVGAGGGCAGSVDYYVTRTLKLNGNSQALVGEGPSRFPGGAVQIKFPRDLNGPAVWVPATVYNGYLGNLFLNGQKCWNSTDLATFDEPKSLTGLGSDGVLLTGGEPSVYGVTAYCFGRHGFAILGDSTTGESAPAQPDFWSIQNSFAYANRAYGVYIDGADSNAGESIGLKTTGNQLGGIYDHSVLGNTHISPSSHVDNRGAVPAGPKLPVVSIASTNGACRLLLNSDSQELTAKDTWITVSGTSDAHNFDGTYRIAAGGGEGLTLTYPCNAPLGAKATGGTVHKSSAGDVYRSYMAKDIPMGAFLGRGGSSIDVWINPYCELNSGPPDFRESSIVIGRGCEGNVLGDRTWTSWIPGAGWGSTMRVGQGLSLDNASDTMNWLTIRAGRTKDQYKGIRFAGPKASYWEIAQANDSYFFISDAQSKGPPSILLNKGGTTDISAPNNAAVRVGRDSTGGVQFFGGSREVASIDNTGKGTFSSVCLTPNICWSAGPSAPPPGSCTHSKGGSLYTRTNGDASNTFYVCNGSTATWMAR